jgi:polyribonucleotide nucleotidyltransferase
LVEAKNRYVKRIEAKNISPDSKEKLIGPGRDIIALISELDNAKVARNGVAR